MAKPKVQSLDQIMGELNTVYDPARQNISRRKEALPGQFEADRMALTGRKENEFRNINDVAAGQGQSFSGTPIAEQQRFLGEQYLPGQQRLVQQEQSQMMELEGLLEELLGAQRGRALDMRNEQKSTLQQFMEAERDRKFRAEEARKQREAAAQEAARGRAFTASQNASAAPSQQENMGQDRANLTQWLKQENLVGRDGKVSPSTFRQLMTQWRGAGYDDASFVENFDHLVNNSHRGEYYGSGFSPNRPTVMR